MKLVFTLPMTQMSYQKKSCSVDYGVVFFIHEHMSYQLHILFS